MPAETAGTTGAAPWLTVVTVVKNDEAGLRETAGGLAVQRVSGWEWLVLDGGSIDGTAAWLAGCPTPQPRWWRSHADDGLYAAMNEGLRRATGTHVWFLNAGDRPADADSLARLRDCLRARPDIVLADALVADPRGGLSVKRARPAWMAWYGLPTHHQSIVYRRDLLEGLAYDPAWRIGADYALTLLALRRARRVACPRFALCRFAAGGVSEREARVGRAEQAAIRRGILGWPACACALLRGVQAASAWLRGRRPALFARLRYRPPRS